jgi:cyclic beta-1,2-glucan synthetase
LNPGYIKGYVPGVRENGGQYTHAAIWAAMAFAKAGDTKRAWELTSMINPINHGATELKAAVYKVEPYVMAADIYSCEPHTGRGGWTWYTGSAGWMYRLIFESILGLSLKIDKLYIEPCIPAEWNSFIVNYMYHETLYHIEIKQIAGELKTEKKIRLNGIFLKNNYIELVNDHREHLIEVRIGVDELPG